MNLLRRISRFGLCAMTLLAASAALACDELPHGVEFCSENTEFRLIQEAPDKRGLIYGLPSDSPHEVLGMVFVYDRPEEVHSQDEMFSTLNESLNEGAKIHVQDSLSFDNSVFDRIVWENPTRTGPQIAARSLYWNEEFFILAFTTEPGIDLSLGHLSLHELLVSNLRLPGGGS